MGALMDLSLSASVIAGWGAWLTVGLAILVWTRRAHEAQLHGTAVRSVARPVPAKPKSGVRAPRPAAAPIDAFGELQAMLEPAADLSTSRRPGD